MTHAIRRTTPRGPGSPFRGECVKCGRTDLWLSDAQKPCPKDDEMSDDEALLMILKEEHK